jgi:hypothetical protein
MRSALLTPNGPAKMTAEVSFAACLNERPGAMVRVRTLKTAEACGSSSSFDVHRTGTAASETAFRAISICLADALKIGATLFAKTRLGKYF